MKPVIKSSKQGGGKLLELEKDDKAVSTPNVAKTKEVELEKPKFIGRTTNEPNFVELKQEENVNSIKFIYFYCLALS
jgi:hypothetical protein